ncbi:MAG TPA: aminoacyl-tRNA hydrolase [Patescibacteria group bacterium]|nr:aminoacyl-tRNA hydrolase [Patescibacteria group bacterium]
MILIVGLGNPGLKYGKTRHNVGFMVLDALLRKLTPVNEGNWEENKKFNSLVARVGDNLVLAKPQSFMNASGGPVAKLVRFYQVKPASLYLVHDDVDLPLGKIKIAVGHGSAGHKGAESVIKSLRSQDFVRLRVGVGRNQKIATDSFVLMPFTLWERAKLKPAVKKSVEALETILKEGVEKAANRYNR